MTNIDAEQSPIYPYASVAANVGIFIIVYDPYRVETCRKQIAQFDATRIIDSPSAQVVVLIPTMKQHIESGSPVDLDVLRHGVDVVGVYDADSARRVGKALVGSGVRVVLLPSPRLRNITRHDEMNDKQKLAGKAAALQLLFNVSAQEARQAASQLAVEIPAANMPKYAQEQGEG
jgi:hypothetical protein